MILASVNVRRWPSWTHLNTDEKTRHVSLLDLPSKNASEVPNLNPAATSSSSPLRQWLRWGFLALLTSLRWHMLNSFHNHIRTSE
ncbi:hypothetical protein PM082_020184 [Marasmius tenuissimus]|nr:hypothetical protein PM082_020184 [Marasmius tenuissimus]